jgi:hypothetical protein
MKKRRRTGIKGEAGLKQHQSCAKAITVALITLSANYTIKKLKKEELPDNAKKRFREIQRKYGYILFLECAKEAIDRIKEKPIITLNISNKKTSVLLQVEYLEDYYNKLKGEE